jgi:hypothetical protein
MATEDEITYDELVSLEAEFLQDMLGTDCLTEIEIRDAFKSAITQYLKIVEAMGDVD